MTTHKKVQVSVEMPDGSTRAWTTDDLGKHTPIDEVRHEFNWWGTHRLVVGGVASEWEPYNQPVMHAGYMALTSYWGDKEQLFQITPMKYQAPISVCKECGAEFQIETSTDPDVPWQVYKACQHIVELLNREGFAGYHTKWEDRRK